MLKCALEELEFALEPGDLVEWAKGDPALGFLRAERLREFTAAVGTKAPAEPSTPLAQLKPIGHAHAAALRGAGLETADDLVRRASTPGKRTELANVLEVRADRLLSWALLAEMLLVQGISPDDANLLDAADIDSLDSLKRYGAADLTALLRDVVATEEPDAEAPTVETVTTWVADARTLASRIQISEPTPT